MFEEYLSQLADDDRQALQKVIDHVVAVVPEAHEGRSYGLPAFLYENRPLLGFAVTKAHIALYPFSPAAIEAVAAQLSGYKLSKGTIRFTADRPVEPDVLTQLIRRRMAEIATG